MDRTIISLGFILLIGSFLLMLRAKAKFSDEAILEYQKKIKPGFIKYYLIGTSPLFLILFFLLTDDFLFVKYSFYLLMIMAGALLMDILTFYKLSRLIKSSPFADEMGQTKTAILILLFSKTLTLAGLLLYLKNSLTTI